MCDFGHYEIDVNLYSILALVDNRDKKGAPYRRRYGAPIILN